jgi:TatD DNase family protein
MYSLESILTIGCKPENWRKVEHFLQFEEVYGAFGVHPLNANAFEENTFSTTVSDGLKALHQKYPGKMKAIGECGLDYYVCPDVANAKEWVCPIDCREHQQFVFKEQILLAKEMNLPLVVHARDAGDGDAESDCLDIMRKHCERRKRFTCTVSPEPRRLLKSYYSPFRT